VEAGLVARRVNPASRREVLLQLTQAGKELVDAVISRRREEIAAVIAKMSPLDRAGLVRALRAFAAAGKEYPDEEIDRDLLSLGWQ
jgi:DNA-binding MarR family transcriptional regulator